MKATGKVRYLSGVVSAADISSSKSPIAVEGLAPIFENERRGYGYIVRRFEPFVAVNATQTDATPMLLTTYSERDLNALANGGAAGGNQVLKILGIQDGIHPAANDRVVATYSPIVGSFGVVKYDSLVVQSLSIGADFSRGICSYYIELVEVELSADETVLALLGESDMNVGNLEVAD